MPLISVTPVVVVNKVYEIKKTKEFNTETKRSLILILLWSDPMSQWMLLVYISDDILYTAEALEQLSKKCVRV